MKKLMIILLLLLPLTAYASEADDVISRQMEQSGISELSQQLEKLKNSDYSEIIPDFDIAEMTKSLARVGQSDGWSWNVSSIIKRAFSFFCKEFLISMKIMLSLLCLSLLCSLTENLQKSFSAEGSGAFIACFFLIAAVAVKAFMDCVALTVSVIDNMIVFVNALIPTTLTLLATSGAAVSAGIFHPVLVLSVQTVTYIIKSFVIPLILTSAALSIAGNIGERNNVGRMAAVLRNIAKWSMGILLTVFVGIVTVQSLATPAIDGITFKTAKYAVGNFVPVVGNVLAESVELVFGCSVILKNAVGIAGLVAILALCAAPIIRLAAQAAMFCIASALVEPVADKRTADILSQIGQSVTALIVTVTTVTFMFIINLAIIIGAGNAAAVMAR